MSSASPLALARAKNLQRLIDVATQGNVHAFAQLIGFSSLPNYLGQTPKTPMSGKVARQIEALAKIPSESLDSITEYGSFLPAESSLNDDKPPTDAMRKQNQIHFYRKRNLELIVDYLYHGNAHQFAVEQNLTSLGNYIGTRWSRNIGPRLATSVEGVLGLASGALSAESPEGLLHTLSNEQLTDVITRKTNEAQELCEQMMQLTSLTNNAHSQLCSQLTDALVLKLIEGESLHLRRLLQTDNEQHALIPTGWPMPYIITCDVNANNFLVVIHTQCHKFNPENRRYLEWLLAKRGALSHYHIRFMVITTDMPFESAIVDFDTLNKLLAEPDEYHQLTLERFSVPELFEVQIEALHDEMQGHQMTYVSINTQIEEAIDELLSLHKQNRERQRLTCIDASEQLLNEFDIPNYTLSYIRNLASLHYCGGQRDFMLLLPMPDILKIKECRKHIDKFIEESGLKYVNKVTYSLDRHKYLPITIDSRTGQR